MTGNLLIAGSTLLSGCSYSSLKNFSSLLNLEIISQPIYDDIQSSCLIPCIDRAWSREKIRMQHLFSDSEVAVCGDGRCDSPGFTAKYCSYTLMDQVSDLILDFSLIQVTDTGSSVTMERLGYEHTMDSLLAKGMNVTLCATDRHVQIRKLHREKYLPQGILHEFDVYHLANTVRKELKTKVSKKKYNSLQKWQRSVINHLWWSAATCDGNADVLLEKWCSTTEHVVNNHNFPDNKHFKCCHHCELSRETEPEDVVKPTWNQRAPCNIKKKKWLKRDSNAHTDLCSIVLNKKLLKDIRM